ncbi:MAG: Txe/YoeB family addiction module toxin [Alphaproteobacteria bacterium]|nr:Txe/YoeB family addiction module toxin [Alphaproteobacteria bacterium]
MRLAFDPNALEDLRYWIDKDRRKALKIIDLIDATLKSPFDGIGKPEPLRFELAGCWSRRIDQEHRLVYKVEKSEITILACRYHYG